MSAGCAECRALLAQAHDEAKPALLAVRLWPELAAAVGEMTVHVETNEDGLVLDVYRDTEDGFELLNLVPALTAEIQAIVRRQRGDYANARHAMGPTRDAARPNRPGQRWAGFAGRARRRA